MSCSVSSFVILLISGMAGPHVFFHRQERTARKNTRSDANERHAHPLTRTVRHRPLHGPSKINVSVPGSVAVSTSVQLESHTIYFYFLDFCLSHVRIRTNGIVPLCVFSSAKAREVSTNLTTDKCKENSNKKGVGRR